jgi:hypothetical protein
VRDDRIGGGSGDRMRGVRRLGWSGQAGANGQRCENCAAYDGGDEFRGCSGLTRSPPATKAMHSLDRIHTRMVSYPTFVTHEHLDAPGGCL